MTLIGLENLLSILIISAYFIGVSFLWLLPLHMWLRKSVLSFQFVIPVSLSVQILIGYIFYSFQASQVYFVPYILGVLLFNVYCVYRIGLGPIIRIFKEIQARVTWKTVGVIAFFLTLVLYSRFFDSFSTSAPGNNDTFNHILFIKDINETGYIRSVTYYAPGFHLLLLPLTTLLPYSELYRFVGPVVGTISVLAIFLLTKPALRNVQTKYLLIALLCFPIFNQLTIQMIGFFSTGLTFIYMTAFLMLLGFSNNRVLPHRYGLIALLTLALVVTVPYFFVQYSFALFLLLLISLGFKKMFAKNFRARLAAMLLISIFAVTGGFFHVLLQTSLHSTSYFPTVADAPIVREVAEDMPVITEHSSSPSQLGNSVYSTVIPFISAGIDVVKIKAIRPPNSLLALGAYGWIIISIGLAVYSSLQNRRSLFVLAVLTLTYGVITQTGIIEITTYKGRSGWYLLLLAALSVTFVYDRYFAHLTKKVLYGLVCLMAVSSFIFPPRYYRPYHVEQFDVLKSYLEQRQDATAIYSDMREFSLLRDNLVAKPLAEVENMSSLPKGSIVILNTNQPNIDPVLSQQALVTDKDYAAFKQSVRERFHEQLRISEMYLRNGGCTPQALIFESDVSLICVH